jgi:hypothetical protein
MRCKEGECETIDKLCIWPFRNQDGSTIHRACIVPQCVRCGQYSFPTHLVRFVDVQTEGV